MFINQKSQEISFALLRLAIYVRRKELRQRLENLAFQLVEDTAKRDWESALATIDAIQGLVSIGKMIYEVETINSKIILQELETLNAAIRQSVGIGNSGDISDVFSKLPAVTDSSKPAGGNENGYMPENGNGNGISSTIRQSAIIDKIRQSGNTAMKDLLAAFHDVSERTLRYDLQRLCSQGVIDRVGNGGPASYYVIRNKTSSSSL